MVDVLKLRSRMVLKGYSQKALAAEMRARGYKISENTLSAKMNDGAKFDCDDADIICEILEVNNPAERAEIFLA